MGVTPVPQIPLAQVFIPDVESACECNCSVDDYYLSVVAEIHLSPEHREGDRHE
ncbi:hypothetical protein SDC9_209008 [bioreactor metagenome]|uniref:Uncharacterized protein n=1 Tax=bioreactor metagenome TaxID=1076179 RepID=A0A645JNV6_9ZZZZ